MVDEWLKDKARYPGKGVFLKEQSIWAIWLYRVGCKINEDQEGLIRRFKLKLYWLLFRLVETITGISLPKEAKIGGGLRIWHFGNIIVHPNSIIGENCTLRQGVTIGNRYENGPVPIIGDNVDIGAYAQILGGVRVGNNCKIGAMALVLSDVPDNCTVVGVPAKVVIKNKFTI